MDKNAQVVAYREKGNLLLGAILEDKGKKLLLLSEDNKKGNINPEKIEFHLGKSVEITSKDYETAKRIKEIRQSIKEKSTNIQLNDLYELLQEENQGFDYKTLSEYYFAESSEIENHLLMAFALSEDSLYFKLKNNLYYPKPLKLVHELLDERDRVKLNEEKKLQSTNIALKWLSDFIALSDDKANLLPPPVEVMKLLDPVKQYIIFRDFYEKKKQALDIVDQIRTECKLKIDNPIEGMYNFFVSLGIFKDDENLSLLKFHIPINFNEETLAELDEIKDFNEDDIKDRLDLRNLYTISIDDAETKDIDDAISLEIMEDRYRLGVHISDVSYFIKAGSHLDNEALNRGMTVYLPLERIAMFPEALSENKISLVQGELRPALSFIIDFNKEYQVINTKTELSVIIVDTKMNYEEVHNILENNELDEAGINFNVLYDIACQLKKDREQNGAIEFNNVDVKVRLKEDGTLYLKTNDRNLKSDDIIKEFMVYSNFLALKYCFKNDIPAIYITQDPPDEPIVLNDEIRSNKGLLIEQLKRMKKAEISMLPGRHFALGLDFYGQSTSPIRRYHDLITHRQIINSLLHNTPCYSVEEIQKVAATAEKATKEVKTIERETNRFWLLKYLKQEKKSLFKANVLRKISNGYLIEIQEVFLQAPLMTPAQLEINQKIEIMIDRVNPLLNVLSVKRKT